MTQGVIQLLRRVINELLMFMWELSTETNRIETAVVRLQVAPILATVILYAEDLGECFVKCLNSSSLLLSQTLCAITDCDYTAVFTGLDAVSA